MVVSAPTGAGKTYIAAEAMAELLAHGGRTWYASPLKALSNAKYLEFGRQFGPERVGLLTGDHKVNPEAPVIVGTTEILRNQLYDAMNRGQDLAADLVVMDEAHYLADPDRGVVWEEVVIYLPARVRLLLLSATVANAQEIADWLSSVRTETAEAVITFERPVPLYPLFLLPDGELVPLTKGPSLSPRVRHFLKTNPPRGRRGGPARPPYARILKVLGQADLLPAIFFLKSRADCDEALSRSFAAAEEGDPELRDRREARLDEFLERYPFLKDHPHLKYVRGPGVAAHHAGHLPHWKMMIEQLMQEGLLAAIFSTSTVAAGVNFPARTVVLCQSDRFNGREFVDLSATDLLQMTGRAGRRGMDRIGFFLVVPGPFQDPQLICSLFSSSPEPVRSQIQTNFSMVLNLLLSHRPEEIKPLLELSLASFQQRKSRAPKGLNRVVTRLTELLAPGRCPSPEQALLFFQRFRTLQSEARRLARVIARVKNEVQLKSALQPGRLFEVHGGQKFCVLEPQERRGRPGVLAAKVREDLGLKKGRVRQTWVALPRVARVLATRLDLDAETDPGEALGLIRAAAGARPEVLDPETLVSSEEAQELTRLEAQGAEVQKALARLPCQDCPLFSECLGRRQSEAFRLLTRWEALLAESESAAQALWSAFLRQLEFLRAEGFVGPGDELSADGRWAAQLRLDYPLLIAAGIRARAWPENDPEVLAALVAPFVMDKEREAAEGPPGGSAPPELLPAWARLDKAVQPLLSRLKAWGFETPSLSLRPARAIHAWATRGDWEDAVRLYGLDPGDLAMLVFRTADNLRQIASLTETHPDLARTARAAVDLILKPPVLVPL